MFRDETQSVVRKARSSQSSSKVSIVSEKESSYLLTQTHLLLADPKDLGVPICRLWVHRV